MAGNPEQDARANPVGGMEATPEPDAEAAPLGGVAGTPDASPHNGEQPVGNEAVSPLNAYQKTYVDDTQPNSGPHSKSLSRPKSGYWHRRCGKKKGDIEPGTATPANDSTPNKEILDVLRKSIYTKHKWKRMFGKLGEQEAILVFERLHLENIRQHQLELLIRARGQPGEENANDELRPKLLGQAENDPHNATPQQSRREIHGLLHDYRQAIDDFEFLRRLPKSTLVETREFKEYLQDTGISIIGIGQQRIKRGTKYFRTAFQLSLYIGIQLCFATLGGLFLIVPLIIMVYVPGRTASVVTTCVSVFVFALTLAVWSLISRILELGLITLNGLELGRFEAKDIVGATAAYAAVLAIFVGATSKCEFVCSSIGELEAHRQLSKDRCGGCPKSLKVRMAFFCNPETPPINKIGLARMDPKTFAKPAPPPELAEAAGNRIYGHAIAPSAEILSHPPQPHNVNGENTSKKYKTRPKPRKEHQNSSSRASPTPPLSPPASTAGSSITNDDRKFDGPIIVPLAKLQQLVQLCTDVLRESRGLNPEPDLERGERRSQDLHIGLDISLTEEKQIAFAWPGIGTDDPRYKHMMLIWDEVEPFQLKRVPVMAEHELSPDSEFAAYRTVDDLYSNAGGGPISKEDRASALAWRVMRYKAWHLEWSSILIVCCYSYAKDADCSIGMILEHCYWNKVLAQPESLNHMDYLNHVQSVIKSLFILNFVFSCSELSPVPERYPSAIIGTIFSERPESLLGIRVSAMFRLLHIAYSDYRNLDLDCASGSTLRIDDLNINSLRSIGNLSIVWTDVVEDHLKLDLNNMTLSVIWEPQYSDSSLIGRFQKS
ncbi:hypothetical protein G7Y89_g5031 [Cudoniella acicularis]|uniref:Uncharacterized protein n=1 Tax=Cudoniella acicularis TaxID=354080 RepID=A0A8H4W638_9HELO|nr:hypothetical protein G7Y89_g5031 [Cudoniella acicularis]